MTRPVAALLLLAAAASAAVADPPGWKAGFGKVKITPPEPMWMSGYASRTAPADGTDTDLWAKSAVFDDPAGNRAVLVTLDLVGVNRQTAQALMKPVLDKYKLNRAAVAVVVSHTHCGPVVGKNLRAMYFLSADDAKKVDAYTDALPGKVLAAVDAAVAGLGPVTLSHAVGSAGFAVNRRANKEAEVPALRAAGTPLKGPVDHAVPVLAARGPDGKLKGVVFGYACHATTLSYQKWSGDYPGYAMADLEAAHPGAVALFATGCGADQNPLPRRTVELAKRYGKELADAVAAVLAGKMPPVSPAVRAEYREVPLPLDHVPTRDDLLKQTEDKNKYVVARAKGLLKQLETADGIPPAYPYPVQTWRLGDGGPVLVFLGGEVVVDYALRLKKELGPAVWPVGYANDVMAYIPSLRVLKEGGYEGASSMIYYGLPSVWGPQVEELIVAEAHRQAKAVRGK